MRETQVRSLGWEDPLEKEMATHSSILAWKNPTDGGAWRAKAHGVTKSQTQLSMHMQRHKFLIIVFSSSFVSGIFFSLKYS